MSMPPPLCLLADKHVFVRLADPIDAGAYFAVNGKVNNIFSNRPVGSYLNAHVVGMSERNAIDTVLYKPASSRYSGVPYFVFTTVCNTDPVVVAADSHASLYELSFYERIILDSLASEGLSPRIKRLRVVVEREDA